MEIIQAGPLLRGLAEADVRGALDRADPTRRYFSRGSFQGDIDFPEAFGHVTAWEARIAAGVWRLSRTYLRNIEAHCDEHGRMPADNVFFLRPSCPVETVALGIAKKCALLEARGAQREIGLQRTNER
jgi:hypothetical protein